MPTPSDLAFLLMGVGIGLIIIGLLALYERWMRQLRMKDAVITEIERLGFDVVAAKARTDHTGRVYVDVLSIERNLHD